MRRKCTILWAVAFLLAPAAPAGDAPPKAPASKKAAGNLEYWLSRAKPTTTQPAATQPAASQPAASQPAPGSPFRKKREFLREDALPGVIELSDGRQLPGGLYTTRERPWIVWSEPTKSWRRIPFINVLSITAVVAEERMELRWRWKGMGEPERVYTGTSYPFRRFRWRFRLLDGSVVEGPTKGQPVWAERNGKKGGPFVLHERSRGPDGMTLKDLVYVKKIVVSRRMMAAVLADQQRHAAAADGPRPAPSQGSPPRRKR